MFFGPKGRGYHHYALNASEQNHMQQRGKNFREKNTMVKNSCSFLCSDYTMKIGQILDILGDLEITANIYCKSRNLPNTDRQIYSTDLR